MNNQQIQNNLIINQNENQSEQKYSEVSQNNGLLNANLELNIIDNNQEQNIIQNQNNINSQNKDIIFQTIFTFIKQNQLDKLATFLSSNKNKIPPNILTDFISIILDTFNADPTIIDIFLANGANVNSIIHNSRYNMDEEQQNNLLMYSIITNNLELFRVVIKYKPDIFLENNNRENSLIKSILFNDENNPVMLQELLKLSNEAINSTYFDQNNNITHNLLTFATSQNKKNIVALLLDNHCNINYQIPETGETAMHLAVKYDYIEIAEILKMSPNFNKNIKNNSGKTPKDISIDLRGRIFYKGVSQMNHNNNNLTKDNEFNNINNLNNNFQNMNNNINSNMNQKNIEKKDNNDNEYGYYEDNVQDNLIIPIEFQSVDYPTYLSMGQDIKLCLNLFQSDDSLNQQIEEYEKQLKEKKETIKKNEEYIEKKKIEISKIKQDIADAEENIKLKNKTKLEQEKEISDIKAQNEDYKKLLDNLENTQQKEDPAINPIEKNNNEIFTFPQNQITEEEFKFLERKFHTQPYDHNYIVSCLQKDLTDYQAYVKEQIDQKSPSIKTILDELQSVVNEVSPKYKVNLYGSYSTGLCLPWSDIDTVITCENGHPDEFFLSKLYIKLTNKPWVREHKFIENTAIPIIKLVSNDKFNFHIDISEESEKHFGLKTVELVKSYLNAYSVLKPIILALKTLLNNGNLNNPYTGGLSSYGLILMVVSFIQSEIDNDKYNEKSPNILGETFLNVLGHYGIFFDYNNYVIITYLVDDSNENNDRDNSFSFVPNSHELIIVDPLNKQNNVAKSTFQFMNIKMGFLIAFMVAKEDCECGCHYGCIQNKLEKTDHCILKRIFNSIKRFKDANKNIY